MRTAIITDPKHKKGKTHASPEPVRASSAGNTYGAEAGTPLFLQPKLKIGSPGDQYEQEADHVADAIANAGPNSDVKKCPACSRGAPCSSCEKKSGVMQRKSDSVPTGAATAVSHSPIAALGPGEPLEPSTRFFMESHFDQDFSDVRIHSGAAAARSAARFNARAYTVGSDLVFGKNKPSFTSADGRRLLAHELSHVVQQRSKSAPMVLRRDPQPTEAGTFHPQPVGTLGASQLLTEIANQEAWQQGHDSLDGEYYAEAAYYQALLDERTRRVRAGELWLAPSAASSGNVLYQLVPAAGGTLVVQVDASTPVPPGAAVVTPAQLSTILQAKNIPVVDPASNVCLAPQSALPSAVSSGVIGGHMNIPGFEARLPGTFANPANAWTLPRRWTGNVGELSLASRSLFGATSLEGQMWTYVNRRGQIIQQTGNFPIWDVQRSVRDQLVQVKTSGSATAAERMSLYESGLFDIFGGADARRQTTFRRAVANVFQGMSPANATLEAFRQGMLAVNADDVAAFRQRVLTGVSNDPYSYRAIIDALLSIQPESVGNQTFRSFAQIDSARLQAGDRSELLSRVARRAADRVISNGLSTEQVVNFRTARTGFGLGAASAPPEQIVTQAFPEWLMAERYGGGFTGTAKAMGKSGFYGGAASAGLGGALDIAGTWLTTGELPSWQQVGTTMASSGTAGFVGAAAESWVGRNIAQYGIEEGFSGTTFLLLGRSGAAGFGGGLGGPVGAAMQLYLTDPNATAEDYFAKTGRAVVPGAVSGFSGALAAGGTASLLGSEVPIVGNVVGFIVGVGVYMIVDSAIGEAVESSLREVAESFALFKDTPRFIKAATWSGYGTPEARRAYCQEAEFQAEQQGRDLYDVEPLCGIFK